MVHRGRIDVLRKVFIARVGPLAAHTASRLLVKLGERRALDVAQMANGDNHGVVGIEVFCIEFVFVGDDFGAPFVTKLLLHFLQFGLHHTLTLFGIVQNKLQSGNKFFQFLIFCVQLFDTQARELRQTHVYDGFTLQFIKLETFLQIALCLRRSFALANDLHHFVDVVAGNDESFQNVGALLRFLQVELGAANGNVVTMLYKVFHTFFKREQAWTPLHQRNVVHRERALQLRHLKQFVQHHVGIGVAFHVYHDTHTLSSRLVVGVRDALQAAFFHQVGNVFDELRLVYAVRYFANHNLIVTFIALNLGLSTQHDTPAARFVGVFHAL